ncbi:MAG: hypothetical protein ONB48_05070 [candidate division KSB1 bacterium]|nr:hypothetical protein [candidate division KSB1 bacterium]MDZ7276559.1 hypothetical protein [candidate division KSB1 bacterium]MDZ7285022.1 hypothetical protein [candidate division KSB1 bacterium]MDZ7298054.1 hypothetical protein [candidate division KSB1 bacterium]MDZ7307442.1 hypothetical protein [candidate division KSB1 bacterium]
MTAPLTARCCRLRAGLLCFVIATAGHAQKMVDLQRFAGLPRLPIAPDTLALLLVEFDDVTHAWYDSAGVRIPFDRVYRWRDFHNMMASRGCYFTEHTGMRSPEGEPVFGSFVDYFADMSGGKYVPVVQILNDSTADGLPRWLPLGARKTAYFGAANWDKLYQHARQAAARHGLDVRITPQRRMVIIYAGNRRGKGARLFGVCDARPLPEFFFSSERWTFTGGANDYDEARHARLSHMGPFCHEMNHMLGEMHHDVALWDMMGNGHKNSVAGGFGNCPAPLNPWFRARLGWLALHEMPCNRRVTLVYGDARHNFYLWQVPQQGFALLFEHRRYHRGYDRGLPGRAAGEAGGLLIWRISGGSSDLLEADGRSGEDNAVHDIFRVTSAPADTTRDLLLRRRPLPLASLTRLHKQVPGLAVEILQQRGDTLKLRVKCP